LIKKHINPLAVCISGYIITIHKIDYYPANTIGIEYNWTSKDCTRKRTV